MKSVPTYPLDWVWRLLGLKFRITDPGIDTFPKLYRRGPDVILYARYLTPKRYLFWLRTGNRILVLSQLVFFISLLLWIFPESRRNCGPSNLLFLGASSLGLFVVFTTHLHRFLARLFLAKKTVIEFGAKSVRLYRNGYGLSWPCRFRRHPTLDVSAELTEHEQSAAEQLRLRNPELGDETAAIVYQSSYRIKLIHGTRVERVAEVYDEFAARRFVAGIKQAEALRQEIVKQRLLRQSQKKGLSA